MHCPAPAGVPDHYRCLFEVTRVILDRESSARTGAAPVDRNIREVCYRLGCRYPVRIDLLTKEILARLVSRRTGDRRTVQDAGDVLLTVRTIARPGHTAPGERGSYFHLREYRLARPHREAMRDQGQAQYSCTEEFLNQCLHDVVVLSEQ